MDIHLNERGNRVHHMRSIPANNVCDTTKEIGGIVQNSSPQTDRVNYRMHSIRFSTGQ